MKLLAPILVCAVMLHADVVVMKNGDRVTGGVIKKDGDAVTLKSVHFGTITLPWAEIDSITTDTLLNAELANGQKVQGPVTTAGGQVRIGGQSVAAADVKVLRDSAEQAAYERRLHPSWTQLWAGTGTIGWAGAAGNARTSTFTTGMKAERPTNTDKTAVYFNSINASALVNNVKQDTAQAVRGGVGYSRNLLPKLFVSGFNDWEYDRFQALDLRVVIGGGVGYSVWKSGRLRLDLPAGLAWSHSKFDPAPSSKFTRNAAELYWGDDFSYKLNSRTNLTQGYRMFNNLSDTGQDRVNFDIGASTQIFKWLSWNLTGSDRYLSNPAPGRKTNDVLYSLGFGINFSH
jgi:putative salt-induced outer membrane protein YdiY